jgi:hypothetical protein
MSISAGFNNAVIARSLPLRGAATWQSQPIVNNHSSVIIYQSLALYISAFESFDFSFVTFLFLIRSFMLSISVCNFQLMTAIENKIKLKTQNRIDVPNPNQSSRPPDIYTAVKHAKKPTIVTVINIIYAI